MFGLQDHYEGKADHDDAADGLRHPALPLGHSAGTEGDQKVDQDEEKGSGIHKRIESGPKEMGPADSGTVALEQTGHINGGKDCGATQFDKVHSDSQGEGQGDREHQCELCPTFQYLQDPKIGETANTCRGQERTEQDCQQRETRERDALEYAGIGEVSWDRQSRLIRSRDQEATLW